MKIDIFSHVIPPKFLKALQDKVPPQQKDAVVRTASPPTTYDLDLRFRIMDRFEDLMQVLTVPSPLVETLGPNAIELARLANDEMAELLVKHPDRFVSAAALIPMNDMDAALRETDRAIKELRFRGVQIFSSPNGEPIDSPKFLPLFEKMSQYNLPIWIHPEINFAVPEMKQTMVDIAHLMITFRWPYETTIAMARLVYSGVLERYPNLMIITHHCGGMVPFFAGRVAQSHDTQEMRVRTKFKTEFTVHPIEHFRKFYADTVVQGNVSALMCGYEFFGADRLLFGTDMPYYNQLGARTTRNTIRAIQEMDIPEADKKKIFEENAKRILRITL
ncbi:MAG: Amidohydro-rel protein [Dehalococcoidia bacterium]|nr:Amidohydro-rel protein [Dehalococcoidia bacterium]